MFRLFAAAVVVIVVIASVPVASICAVNTLFGLAIPISFKTCLAALVLLLAVGNSGLNNK